MSDRVERVRQTLAMCDADYNVRPEIEDIGHLLHQYDRLRADAVRRIEETDRVLVANARLRAELAAKDARIAELEGAVEINKVGVANLRARAERAEAELKAMREALERVLLHDPKKPGLGFGGDWPLLVESIMSTAREGLEHAVLAPSSAGGSKDLPSYREMRGIFRE